MQPYPRRPGVEGAEVTVPGMLCSCGAGALKARTCCPGRSCTAAPSQRWPCSGTPASWPPLAWTAASSCFQPGCEPCQLFVSLHWLATAWPEGKLQSIVSHPKPETPKPSSASRMVTFAASTTDCGHTQAPAPAQPVQPFAECGRSTSFWALAWSSPETLVTAGTTGRGRCCCPAAYRPAALTTPSSYAQQLRC